MPALQGCLGNSGTTGYQGDVLSSLILILCGLGENHESSEALDLLSTFWEHSPTPNKYK